MTKNKKLLDLIFSHRAKRVWNFLFVFFAVVFLFLLTSPALAQDMNQGLGEFANETGLPATPLPVLIGRIVRIFIGFLGLIAVVIVLYGGFIWMTSGGDSDKIDKAKKLMRAGLIGLLIIVLAYALATFVIYLIGRIIGPGGPGGGCTINEQRGLCELCVGPEPGHWAWQYQWQGCSFNPEDFIVNKILTTHGGDYYNNDVYLCSAVQPMFNHWVDGAVIRELARDKRLIILDPLDNIVDGAWQSARNMSIFKHPALFLANTAYRAFLPKDIADTNGKLLQLCRADGSCPYNPLSLSYIWTFTTGTDTDTTKPYINSTYPISDKNDQTYPDTNVSRKPILEVNFSEPIDMTTVVEPDPEDPNYGNLIPENVWVAEIDGRDGPIIKTLLASDWSVDMSEKGFRFYLKGDNVLTPFAWYRVHVGNIADLCNNTMDPAVEWEFQTNDRAPGIESYYPTGNQVCPNTNVAITFNTSMYENRVKLEVVRKSDNIIIMSGEMKPSPSAFGPSYSVPGLGGTFYVADKNDNPVDNNFRTFIFDSTIDLSNNTQYQVNVTTDLIINTQGDTLEQDWTFTTATPETCLCAPYIYNIDPSRGPKGQCVTVNGTCFKGTSAQPATPKDGNINFIFKDDDNNPVSVTSTVQAVTDNSLTTIVPITSYPDIRPKAQLTIKYGPPNNSELTSNQSEFYINQPGEANGPCLWSVVPNSGKAGETRVTLNGIRFGPGIPTSDGVFFYNQQKVKDCPAGPFGKCEWTNTKISNAMVPGTAQSGDVVVVTDRGTSNGVPFTVITPGGGAGDPCRDIGNVCQTGAIECKNPANYFCLVNETDCRCCCRPDPNSCQNGLTCMKNQGTCTGDSRGLCCGCQSDEQCGNGAGCGILDPNRCCYPNPIIESKDPDDGDMGVCKNTSVQVIFNQLMDVARLSSSNISFGQCETQKCPLITQVPVDIIVDQYISPDKTGFTIYPRGCLLQPNTWYIVTVKGKQPGGKMGDGVRSAKGVSMLGTVQWVFQTSDSLCIIDKVVIHPTSATIAVNGTQHYSASALANNKPVCVASFDWTSSKVNVATVNPAAGLETTATGLTRGQTIISGGVEVERGILKYFVKGDSALTVRLTSLAIDDNSACAPSAKPPQYPSPNPRPNNQQACINIKISARFNKNVVDERINDTGLIKVLNCGIDKQCKDPIPIKVIAKPIRGIWVYPYTTSTEEFIFEPLRDLLPDTYYRVIVPGGDDGVLGEDDSTMANDYIWNFKTKTGIVCPIEAVEIDPMAARIEIISGTQNYLSAALGQDCQRLTGDFIWRWSTTDTEDPPVATLDPLSPGDTTTATANHLGETDVKAQTGNKSNVSHLVVAPAPVITSKSPAPNSQNVCRNALISARFDQELDRATINLSTVILWEKDLPPPPPPGRGSDRLWEFFKNIALRIKSVFFSDVSAAIPGGRTGWTRVEGQVVSSVANNTTLVTFIPNAALATQRLYEVEIKGGQNGIKSKYGTAMASDSLWQFTTGTDICQIDRINLTPTIYLFNKSGDQYKKSFTATALARDNQEIQPIPGVYTWTWEWSALPVNLVTVRGDQNNPSTGLVTAGNKNGSTTLKAEATDSSNRQVFASAAIKIFLCENPWIYDNSDYNFELSYCRDGNPLLPDIGTPKEVLPPGSDSKLHLLFSVPNTSDLVGLMVYDNFDHLTPLEWYPANVSNPGSPGTLTVDGYRALRDGRTVYVNAVNVDNGGKIRKFPPDLYSNIFLISYNDNAAPGTINIVGQLIQNWQFNINLFSSDHDKLVRDLERIYHFNQISAMLYKYYQANRLYPDLESGVYIKSMSVSRWPSWQQALADELDTTLPIDPINLFADRQCVDTSVNPPQNYSCCADCLVADPQCSGVNPAQPKGTCYNPAPDKKKYECISGSHVYQYNYQSSARNYSLYSNFEYGQPSYWQQNCGVHDTADLCAQHNWCAWSNNQCQAKRLNYSGDPCLLPFPPSACGCFNMRYQPAAVLGGQRGQNEWTK